jgi:hypothetical protein
MIQAVITYYIFSMQYFLIIGLSAILSFAQPALAAENLITNPSAAPRTSTGDPAGWLRGGYGDNVRSHTIKPCPAEFSSWHPVCPENTAQILSVSASPVSGDIYTIFEGDAKWYWQPLPVKYGSYRLQFDYQAYTWGAEATAWYKLKDGGDVYQQLTKLPQIGGGMGYEHWQKADLTFTPPADTATFTVFLSTTGRLDCSGTQVASLCKNPTYRTLNLANVTLEGVGQPLGRAELLAQIAALEAEIARLQKLLADLRSRV